MAAADARAKAIEEAACHVRTGPLSQMRAMTELTPEDLDAGADRAERDAAARRAVAAAMRIEGVKTLMPSEVREHPCYRAAAR